MAADPLVEAGFEGDQYMVPKSVLQAGMAKQFIEDQLAEQADRAAQKKAKVQESVEGEFRSIKTKLKKVDLLTERIDQLEDANTAYRVANEALRAQIDALEDSNGGLGSTSSKARQASMDLSQQVTGAAVMTESLARQRDAMTRQEEGMQLSLEQHETRQQKVLADASNAAVTRQRLAQEEVNALKDTVAKLEARAVEAEAVAARALRDAEASKNLGRNDISRDDLLNLIHAELTATTENIAEAVIAQMKDQFPQGPGGIRMDAQFMEQTRKDGVTDQEIRYGTDQAMKRTLKKAQGFS